MFRKSVWIPFLIVLLTVIGGGLFYSSRVGKQEPAKVYKPVEVENPATPKPKPPGETAKSGHWHGDEWHAEPHSETPEVSAGAVSEPDTPQNAADTTTKVQGAPLIAQPENGQINTPTQEASQPTQKAHKTFYGPEWAEWSKKEVELSDKRMQVYEKVNDALTAIEFKTEEQTKKEMRRIFTENEFEMNEANRLYKAHKEKEPVRP